MTNTPIYDILLDESKRTDFLLPTTKAQSRFGKLNRFLAFNRNVPFLLGEMMRDKKGRFQKGHTVSEEIRKKMSESLKGRIPWNKDKYHSEETKRKISLAGKGELNSNWKGDEAKYVALHTRVMIQRGTPMFCEICKITDERKRYDWANLTGNYIDVMDYKRMCRPCHKVYDKKRKLNNVTPNLKIDTSRT